MAKTRKHYEISEDDYLKEIEEIKELFAQCKNKIDKKLLPAVEKAMSEL